MKKIFSMVLCVAILLAFSACGSDSNKDDYLLSTDTAQQNEETSQETTESKNTVNFNGVEYLVNSSLDFEVNDVFEEEYEKDGVTLVYFCNLINGFDDAELGEDGVYETIGFLYNGLYSDVCNSNATIIGSAKMYYRSDIETEELVESYMVIYDENCNMIIKADSYYSYLGQYLNYYDSNYNVITEGSTYYNNEVDDYQIKYVNSEGKEITSDELDSKLKDLCNNDYIAKYLLEIL